MFVVETKATGDDIFALLICCPGFLALAVRAGSGSGVSERMIARLVKARARDIVVDILDRYFGVANVFKDSAAGPTTSIFNFRDAGGAGT